MCKRRSRAVQTLIFGIALACIASPGWAAFEVNMDFGGAFPGDIALRAPKTGGTPLSFSDNLHASLSLFIRFQAEWAITRKHAIFGAAAPLRLGAYGPAPGPIIFTNASGAHTPAFAENEPITANYRMDTYRLGYRYTLIDMPQFRFKLGLSARFRSGAIKLRGLGHEAACPNSDIALFLGLHYSMDFFTGSGWTLLLDGDSLFFRDGYGHDIFAGVRHDLVGRFFVRWGWRAMFEKKDTDALFTKARIHLITLGAGVRL